LILQGKVMQEVEVYGKAENIHQGFITTSSNYMLGYKTRKEKRVKLLTRASVLLSLCSRVFNT
jgi:hypothetical protein